MVRPAADPDAWPMTYHPTVFEQLARERQQDLLADAHRHRPVRRLERSQVRRSIGVVAALRRVVGIHRRRAVRRPATV
jgi:hypothetical protein